MKNLNLIILVCFFGQPIWAQLINSELNNKLLTIYEQDPNTNQIFPKINLGEENSNGYFQLYNTGSWPTIEAGVENISNAGYLRVSNGLGTNVWSKLNHFGTTIKNDDSYTYYFHGYLGYEDGDGNSLSISPINANLNVTESGGKSAGVDNGILYSCLDTDCSTLSPTSLNIGDGIEISSGNFRLTDKDVYIGDNAGRDLLYDKENVLIGSGSIFGGSKNHSNGKNVVIGFGSRVNSITSTNSLVLGHSALGKGSNSAVIGNSNISRVYMNQEGKASLFSGDIRVTNGTPSLELFDDADNRVEFKLREYDNNIIIDDMDGWLTINNNNPTYISDATGNVGVQFDGLAGGTLDKTGKIQVFSKGTNAHNMIQLNAENTYYTDIPSDFNFGIYLGSSYDPGIFGNSFKASMIITYNGLNTAAINEDGDYLQFSDQRMKYDINEIKSVLLSLMKLKPTNYKLKHSKKSNSGFLAQNVKENFPRAISIINEDGMDKHFINYNYFTPILTKAIQEQQEIIEHQQKEIDQLKEQNKLIHKLIQQIEHKIN